MNGGKGGMLVSLVVTVVSVAVMLTAGHLGYGTVASVFKMIASCGFIAIALTAGALQSPYGWAILAGLFFSWWGDLFLISGKSNIFLMGLIAFFLGHVAYCVAFLVHGVQLSWVLIALAVLAGPVVGILFWLNDSLGDMRIPVYAYIAVITTMVALSSGAVGRGGTMLIVIGAVLFYVSDVCVARQRFIADEYVNRLLGLPLYYGGQIVLAWTVKLVNDRASGGPA